MWLDLRVSAGLGAAQLAAEQGIEGPLHVARGQRLSVVKANAVMQVKDVGLRIGNLPAVGQPGLQVEMVVATNQRVEEQLVDAFRLGVHANPRIEVGGAALDDHDQRVGIGLAASSRQDRSPQRHRDTERTRRDTETRTCRNSIS